MATDRGFARVSKFGGVHARRPGRYVAGFARIKRAFVRTRRQFEFYRGKAKASAVKNHGEGRDRRPYDKRRAVY
jgi:hypothetical protein